jgi:hypothetical protein
VAFFIMASIADDTFDPISRMTNAPPARLQVRRVGYLVPAGFDGIVHSVYARACNVTAKGSLVTLVAPPIADGPTTLLLENDGIVDLRTCLEAGERIVRQGDRIVARNADVDLADAMCWRPDPTPAIGDFEPIAANLSCATVRLAARLDQHASVLSREGRAVCVRIEQACRDLDADAALRDAVRLVGWGEGLTPAGDDFLVGMLAGLDALAPGIPPRMEFLTRFGAAVAAQADRTTELAEHYIRLAAGGHFGADLHRLRSALLSSSDVARVAQLADDALAAGATSGSDQVAGLLAGISAWLPSNG